MRRFCLAIAVGKIPNFGPRKVALKIIFRLREKNLYVKADPSHQLYLGRKGFYEVFKILKVLNFLRELRQKYGKGKEGGVSKISGKQTPMGERWESYFEKYITTPNSRRGKAKR